MKMQSLNLFSHIDSEEVINVYNNNKNYVVFENDNASDNYAIIYFSSNGIYYPNTYEEFNEQINKKNKFEFYSQDYRLSKAKKTIYVRDVHKQWYLKGINKDINNIDKLVQLIRELSLGLKIICVGSSAGGYIATIVGARLNAEMVYSFSGQFTLEKILSDRKDMIVNEMYKDWLNYYNLKNIVEESTTKVLYFYCFASVIDKYDIEIANKCKNVYSFKFDCELHGVPFDILLSSYDIKKRLALFRGLSGYNN